MNIHFSLDDFFYPLINLKESPYPSIFDQKDFAFLKKLHDTYGMVCSCYCFFEDENSIHSLREVPSHYQSEFQANSHWLRFGFHARNAAVNYGSSLFHTEDTCDSYDQAKTDYENVIRELTRITGGKQCIDHMPRIHYYSGTKADCQAWKDAYDGIKGLLSAENSRLCYYHTEEQRQHLINTQVLHESELGLTFYRTDLRLENEANLLMSLERCINTNKSPLLILFTHAPLMTNKEILEKMELCCLFAQSHSFPFTFPEDFAKEDLYEFQ